MVNCKIVSSILPSPKFHLEKDIDGTCISVFSQPLLLESIHYTSVDYWITVLTFDRLSEQSFIESLQFSAPSSLGVSALSLNLSNPLRKSTSKFCSNSLELTKYLELIQQNWM